MKGMFSFLLSCSHFLFFASLDNSDSDGLFHIPDCKPAKWWVFAEDLTGHWLAWSHSADACISSLDKLR